MLRVTGNQKRIEKGKLKANLAGCFSAGTCNNFKTAKLKSQ